MAHPLVGSRDCTYVYLWNIIRLSPHLFMATYLCVNNRSRYVSDILFQSHAMQGHATSCKVMQSHVMQRHAR